MSRRRGGGVLIRFDTKTEGLGQVDQRMGCLLTDLVHDGIEDGYWMKRYKIN